MFFFFCCGTSMVNPKAPGTWGQRWGGRQRVSWTMWDRRWSDFPHGFLFWNIFGDLYIVFFFLFRIVCRWFLSSLIYIFSVYTGKSMRDFLGDLRWLKVPSNIRISSNKKQCLRPRGSKFGRSSHVYVGMNQHLLVQWFGGMNPQKYQLVWCEQRGYTKFLSHGQRRGFH